MKPAVTNSRARKAGILIPILAVIPLMGLGFYIVPNLLDTTPPILLVSGLELEPLDKPRDPTSIGEWWSTGWR